MKIQRAHKIELKPNNKQVTYFKKACGTARFVYNWALDYSKKQYEIGNSVGWIDIKKHLNSIKHDQYPWMMDVTKCAPEQAIKNLGTAFHNLWKHNMGYPKFKKKYIGLIKINNV